MFLHCDESQDNFADRLAEQYLVERHIQSSNQGFPPS